MNTDVIYEDRELIVIRKPAGFPAQSGRVGQADVASELRKYLAEEARKKGGRAEARCKEPYLGIVHRLDQPVEGLLVFAKTKAAAGALGRQLADGTLNKQYYAVICGKPAEEEGELVDYLRKTKENRAEIVELQGAEGKDSGNREAEQKTGAPQKAVLQYRLIRHISDPAELSLLEIHIETGRFHQIRAQLAHAGMPILGDQKYGGEKERSLAAALGVSSAALCAYRIGFRHPATKKEMRFAVSPEGKAFAFFCLP